MLTQEYLKECLTYNPDTGTFTWNSRPLKSFKSAQYFKAWNTRCSGKVAGYTSSSKYVTIPLAGKLYQAHRLAYLYMEGELPAHEVDHLNHIKTDNRWSNLRQVSPTENQRNRPKNKNNTSGSLGVSWCADRQLWLASARINYIKHNLGRYKTKEEAIAARQAFNKLHFHENHGRSLVCS
jgi:hypothetical protein